MENQVTTGQIVSVPAGPIAVDKVMKDNYGGGKQAQLRQEYKKEYPSKRISSTMQDSLFDAEHLGVTTTDYSDTRVAWIPVGATDTAKTVAAALANHPEACIYKVLSFAAITDDGQKAALQNGLNGDAFDSFIETNSEKFPVLEGKESWDAECSAVLLSIIEAAQTVRYGENNEEGKPADEAVLMNGKVQYRATFFSKTARKDVDRRNIVEKQEIPNLVLATQNVAEAVEA